MHGQLEVGASFSTAPDLKIWKLTLPWIGGGYQFGDVIWGVKIYVKFPF